MGLSFYSAISPISPTSAVVPTLFVITFSMMFDLYEDFIWYIRDRWINNKFTKIWINSTLTEVRFKDIVPGDLIELNCNDEIPADIVLLSFNSHTENAYIETANLDGEKTLKPKSAVFEKFKNFN